MNSRHRRDKLFGYVLGRPEGICLARRWNSRSCTQASLTWAGAELSWKWSSDLHLLAVSARLRSAELRLPRISPLKCFCKKAQEPNPENPATKSTQIIRLGARGKGSLPT